MDFIAFFQKEWIQYDKIKVKVNFKRRW